MTKDKRIQEALLKRIKSEKIGHWQKEVVSDFFHFAIYHLNEHPEDLMDCAKSKIVASFNEAEHKEG